MGKIFSDATEEQEREFIESRRMLNFICLQHPSRWLSAAERHKRAADILYEVAHAAHERNLQRGIKRFLSKEPDGSRQLTSEEYADFLDEQLFSDYLLLIGYTLENCFKGCLLAQNPRLSSGGKLDKYIISHDLCDLANKCGIMISEDDRGLLSLITRNVEWGKYPTALSAEKMPYDYDEKTKFPSPTIAGSEFAGRKIQIQVNAVYVRAVESLLASLDSGLWNSKMSDLFVNYP